MELSLQQFEAQCKALYPSLYRQVVYIVGAPHLAEDVLQEVLLKGYMSLHQLRDGRRLGMWLHRIAVRQAQEAARVWKNAIRRRADVDENLISSNPGPAEVAEEAQWRRLLWEQLDKLSPRQRTAFMLCALEEWEIREAAECMGISEGAVKKHLGRAREKLRSKLSRYFGG